LYLLATSPRNPSTLAFAGHERAHHVGARHAEESGERVESLALRCGHQHENPTLPPHPCRHDYTATASKRPGCRMTDAARRLPTACR